MEDPETMADFPVQRSWHIGFIVAAAIFSFCVGCAAQSVKPSADESPELIKQFADTAKQLSVAPSDACGWESRPSPVHPQSRVQAQNYMFHTAEAADRNFLLEDRLFDEADEVVAQALNDHHGQPARAASQALSGLEAISKKMDNQWPANRQFHFRVLDLHSLIVAKYTIRSRATFAAFGVPEVDAPAGSQKNAAWENVGQDNYRDRVGRGAEELSLYPLWEEPSKSARFLSRFDSISCGDGQTAITYDAYQWDPAGGVVLTTIIHREGAVSGGMIPIPEQGNKASPPYRYLQAIGKLNTSGPRITLPYCWWSAVDDSVWATICSVDTYDLSGDQVRFLGTKDNRPDLAVVAKAIRNSQHRDYRAVLSYCASSAVARRIIDAMPASVFSVATTVTHSAPNKEEVEISDGHDLIFSLVHTGRGWFIASFQVK